MGKWVVAHGVEYSSASDENIDSLTQKYIAEIERVYDLLHRVRSGDLSAGEPTDTTPWQFHVDSMTNILSIRNPADTAWIALGKLNEAKDRFLFENTVTNNGGVPSIQFGLLAERPDTEANGAVFVSTNETGGYRYYRFSTTTSAWSLYNVAIVKDGDGKLVGNLAGKADTAGHADTAATSETAANAAHASSADNATNAAHAETAANATYAATSGEAETAAEAVRLATPVKINGVAFDGTRSINIGVAGNDAEAISGYQSLLWRTAQNEREISNITLALEAQSIYPDYNNLLAIDFVDDTAKLDVSAITVTASSAGSDTIEVDSLAAVRVGSAYIITDGTLQEAVTVKSIAKNGSVFRVVLTATLTNTYTIGSTSLYRTTATINAGAATGATTSLVSGWYPSTTWSGTNALETLLAPMETTLATSSNFTTSGDIAFTADGYVTLQ